MVYLSSSSSMSKATQWYLLSMKSTLQTKKIISLRKNRLKRRVIETQVFRLPITISNESPRNVSSKNKCWIGHFRQITRSQVCMTIYGTAKKALPPRLKRIVVPKLKKNKSGRHCTVLTSHKWNVNINALCSRRNRLTGFKPLLRQMKST